MVNTGGMQQMCDENGQKLTAQVPLLEEIVELSADNSKLEGIWKNKRRTLLIISSLIVGVSLITSVIAFMVVFENVSPENNSNGSGSNSNDNNNNNSNNPEINSKDPNRPQYHVMPKSGWLNDPNGLIYLNGIYHTFFQYNPYSPHWNWSIHWGHAASSDLVHWTLLPPALTPSTNGTDCGGCWSGSMTLSKKNIPTILYTGVAQVDSNCFVPQSQKNWEYNPQDGYRETIMWAQPNLEDNDAILMNWPQKGILVDGPPQGLRLNGWRDPFVYQKAGEAGTDGDYIVLVGTGRMTEDMSQNLGGAVMAYKASNILPNLDWEYQGFIAEGTADDAVMWECPWLVEITPQVGQSQHTHVLSVGGSLWDKTHPLEPLNPVIYWLGTFNETTFKFDMADKQYQYLDLGETFYASNRMIDGNGRILIWGWLRECMSSTDYRCSNHNYAGSLSMPRVLKVEGDTLKQEVPQEMEELRDQLVFSMEQETAVEAENVVELFEGQYHHYEFDITLQRDEAQLSGIMLYRVGFSMLLTYDWNTTMFRAFKDTADNLMAIDPVAHHRGIDNFGGTLQNMENQEELTLRIFVDGSSAEVFASSGQVISLRLYFDESIGDPKETIKLLSYGGQTIFSEGSAWTLNSYWDHPQHYQIKNRALKSFPY